MDLKIPISKTAIDPGLTRVRNRMRREDRETITEGYRADFDKLSIRWGLIFVDQQIVFPIDLRRRLLHILHFGHSGITKMTSEAKIFWWPDLKQDIDNKVKYCTAYTVSSKCLKYQLQPKKVNRAPRVRRSTVHMGLKITLFELHHGRKPRTELTHIVKNGKTYLSIWSELNISAPNRPKISNYGEDQNGRETPQRRYKITEEKVS